MVYRCENSADNESIISDESGRDIAGKIGEDPSASNSLVLADFQIIWGMIFL